ncbi:MAG: DNA-binding protein [Nitrincola sp.]|nr:DNA-binding protein [Nitrincola sp.]
MQKPSKKIKRQFYRKARKEARRSDLHFTISVILFTMIHIIGMYCVSFDIEKSAMARVSNTHQAVFKAADALLEKGVRPTQQNVREVIGSGSITTINKALGDWWASLSERLNAVKTTLKFLSLYFA